MKYVLCVYSNNKFINTEIFKEIQKGKTEYYVNILTKKSTLDELITHYKENPLLINEPSEQGIKLTNPIITLNEFDI